MRSVLLLLMLACLALAADAATPRTRSTRRPPPVPTIDDIIDMRWSADWCAPGGYATITSASLPEKFTRRGYGVRLVARPDTDPEFWKRASDLRIEASELRSMPKEPDGMYHLRGVVDAQIVKITTNESIGKPIGQLIDISGPDCEAQSPASTWVAPNVLTSPQTPNPKPPASKKDQPAPNPPQQSPSPQQPPAPPAAPKRPTNVCETSECSILVRIMKGDGEPCASCLVMFTWSGPGIGPGGDARRLTNERGFVEFRSPVRTLETIATIVNRTGLVLPLRFDIDTLGGTSITITTPYTGR